ncbi:hypothetical protein [Fuchsiella alkaliacetigena]|nr:hypothetical protein [Fuchsiella alkaliacetigena]
MDSELGTIESGLLTALIVILVVSLLQAVGGDLQVLLDYLQGILA